MADLTPLKYGKVVGRFLANIADGPDLGDHPEFLPLSGTVTFTAETPKILVAQAHPAPATYVQLPKHYECQLDEFGYLTWRDQRGIRLVAPTGATNPSGWTWRVSFDLSYDGERVPMESFSFVVPEYIAGPDTANPDAGSTGLVDLTLVSPVPSTSGTAIVRGERGSGIQIDGQVATYAQLPAAPGEGAQFVVKADGLLYVFHAVGGWTANGQGIAIRGVPGTTDWAGITGKPSTFAPVIGSTSTTAVAGNDPRLTDARTPTAHTHTASQITDATALGRSLVTAADGAAVRTAVGAVGESDTRLTNPRTPTAAGQAYDVTFKSHMGSRVSGAGNVAPEGLRIERSVSFTSITYRGETGGTGNLVAELRKNGAAVAGTAATIAAGAHASDTVVTAGTPWAFAAGDRLSVHITTADNPAGKGLQVSLKGMTS